MRKAIDKIKESIISVLPVTIIIVIIGFLFEPFSSADLGNLLLGSLMLIIGTALYTLGSELAIEPMGEHIGARITHTKKLWLILLVCFIIGVIVTIAEPDLSVLATQVDAIPDMVLIGVVALGVGIFIVLSVLRIVFRMEFRWVLIISYSLIFILALFVPEDFLPVAFDSGGVTTGPITVPFIMTMCIGIASVLGGKNSQDSSFGMIGICSIGPVLAVLVLGLFYSPDVSGGGAKPLSFIEAFPLYLIEVAVALAPIIVFFFIFNFFALKLPTRALIKIGVGIVYTYIGISLFLTGANVGFLPAGRHLGYSIASLNEWWLIPIGLMVGAVLVLAEPAVHVLNKQVEELTDGIIKRKTMLLALSISMAVALTMTMLRIIMDISIWWVLFPGYAIALGMSFASPKVFTGIAFDSGGVASGSMTAAFLLPMAMGATQAVGGDILQDAFGVVALVALTPLIAIQGLGLIYKYKIKRSEVADNEFTKMLEAEGVVIELDVKEEGNHKVEIEKLSIEKRIKDIIKKRRKGKSKNSEEDV